MLLLGGPGVYVLRGGGWLGFVVYAVYILVTLALFDRARERWRSAGRGALWFDFAAAGVGALFCFVFLGKL